METAIRQRTENKEMKKSTLKAKLQLLSHLIILIAAFVLLSRFAQPRLDQPQSLANPESTSIQALAALDPFYGKHHGYRKPQPIDPYENLNFRTLLNLDMVESITGYDRFQLIESYERLRNALEETCISIAHSSVWSINKPLSST